MINKKKSMSIVFILFFMIVFAIITCKQKFAKVNILNSATNNNVTILKSEKVIYLEELGLDNFTCTGLTYDKKNDSFWIGDYGALTKDDIPKPRIIEISSDFNEVIDIVDLSDVLYSDANLQGITYDSLSDSLWLATGKYMYNISKNKEVLKVIDLKTYSKYSANGIAFDPDMDSLWVLCYSKYLLNFKKNGSVKEEKKINFKNQDHICLYGGNVLASVGADYNGENNYIIEINKKSGKVQVLYKLKDSYAIEGFCIINGKLFVANDGMYHSAKINKSYISVYNIE